ncbi:hypothetical protein PLICRDRAFT_25529 [Plicaturopsis crispa FD-325 SS-3]|nr:hypothetical protein PLICRDRAFT_25529 [Plicaturopsis crispa FD-325 SS-3]
MQMENVPALATLTSPVLRAPTFAKIDKTQSIKLFVKGQQVHATTHAKEGCSIRESWDQTTPKKPKNADDIQATSIGFGTPILKARVARPVHQASENTDPDSRADDKRCYASSKSPVKTGSIHHTEPKAKPKQINAIIDKESKQSLVHGIPTTKTKPKASPKRKLPADSDGERDARMAERRERKRTKRAIVKPVVLEDSNEESDGEPTEKSPTPKGKGRRTKDRSRKGNKENKPKVPAGFALMHGFSATNVGKNRLTLKPGPSVGVFNKGKASVQTKTSNRKKSGMHAPMNAIFSEFDFLNKKQQWIAANPKRKPASSSLSHDSSDTISHVSVPAPAKKLKKLSTTARSPKKTTVVKSDCSDEDVDDAGQLDANQTATVPNLTRPESIIWDIELDDVSALPEGDVPANAPSTKAGTVIVDTRRVAWAAVPITPSNECIEKDVLALDAGSDSSICEKDAVHVPDDARSMSSLAPSQSASQTGRRRSSEALVPPAVSKYFPNPTGFKKAELPAAPTEGRNEHSDDRPLPEPGTTDCQEPRDTRSIPSPALTECPVRPSITRPIVSDSKGKNEMPPHIYQHEQKYDNLEDLESDGFSAGFQNHGHNTFTQDHHLSRATDEQFAYVEDDNTEHTPYEYEHVPMDYTDEHGFPSFQEVYAAHESDDMDYYALHPMIATFPHEDDPYNDASDLYDEDEYAMQVGDEEDCLSMYEDCANELDCDDGYDMLDRDENGDEELGYLECQNYATYPQFDDTYGFSTPQRCLPFDEFIDTMNKTDDSPLPSTPRML